MLLLFGLFGTEEDFVDHQEPRWQSKLSPIWCIRVISLLILGGYGINGIAAWILCVGEADSSFTSD